MIEVPNVAVPLSRMKGQTPSGQDGLVRAAVIKRLHLVPSDVNSTRVLRRSIDARRGHEVRFIYTVLVQLRGGANAERALLAKLERAGNGSKARLYVEPMVDFPARVAKPLEERPVVVGAGCAGLFAALALAEAGLCPVLLERGCDVRRRVEHVRHFELTGVLNIESNIQFGMGGAGTFSDGKLQTGTKSPLHRLVLETFVRYGAPAEILYDAKPHIGSDILVDVVERMAARIRILGGEIRYQSRVMGMTFAGAGELRHVTGVDVLTHVAADTHDDDAARYAEPTPGVIKQEHLVASAVILASGHSARDVFEMLAELDVAMERKPFAMGVRIEHLQHEVDVCQYGRAAGNPLLGAAPYKLVTRTAGGRSAYSFCMCPGGTVVAAASEPHGVVTNGMSLHAREGRNANAALLVNVNPADLPGDDVLAGIALQRRSEQAAYTAGGGAYVAPAQLVGDFLQGVASSGSGKVEPTYPRGVKWTDLDGLLPSYITQTLAANLPQMAKKLRFFGDPEAVLTGVETRSSSPVRIVRDTSGQSISARGLYPAGEGAGYAGGIMSAATDGLGAAYAVLERL